MTAHHDLDRELTVFFRDGPEELPYQSFDAVRDRIEQTGQRVVIGPWRLPTMNRMLAVGLGAAAVLIIGLFLGYQLVRSPSGGVGSGATPSPTASPSPTAIPEPSVAEPSSTPQAGLPVGPFAYDLPDMADDAPRITLTIAARGWNVIGPGILTKGDDVDNVPEAAIISWSEPPGAEFSVYGDPCAYASTTPDTPATTVEEIVVALAAQASRDASEPMDVTVDGYPGKTIIVHVPDDVDPGSCEGGEFAMFGTAEDDFARFNQGPGQIDELWIIGVEGSIVIFDTMYRPDTPTQLIEEMRALAGSATFEGP